MESSDLLILIFLVVIFGYGCYCYGSFRSQSGGFNGTKDSFIQKGKGHEAVQNFRGARIRSGGVGSGGSDEASGTDGSFITHGGKQIFEDAVIESGAIKGPQVMRIVGRGKKLG